MYENTEDQSKFSRLSRMGVELPALYLPNQKSCIYMNQRSPGVINHHESYKTLQSSSQDVTLPSSEAYIGPTESDTASQKLYCDVSSKSWTSVGMGSTDGKKMIVRKIPATPGELFNIVTPPT